MSSTLEFFQRVLPAAGWKCLLVLPDKRHLWFDPSDPQHLDKMAATALRLDAQGKAVYHALAGFASKKREQSGVVALRALWIDVDAGPSKPYRDLGECYRAVEGWRTDQGLPAPLHVASGGGLHTYWPLRDPVDAGGWLRAAHGLRAAAQRAGLALDAACTIDAARVLRPPGTFNRKLFDESTGKKVSDTGGPARPVLMAADPPDPVPLETLSLHLGTPLFDSARTPVDPEAFLQTIPLKGNNKRQSLEENLSTWSSSSHDPSNPERILDRCAQVRRLRDAHGGLAEPEWYAVLGVLAHCGEPGERLAHRLSSGDPRYTAANTNDKLVHARGAAGPTTCARFGALNPTGCDACEHRGKLTSPIQLGRDLPASTLAAKPKGLELPLLPGAYFWKNGKLAVRLDAKEGEPETDLIVSEYPVVASDFQRGERSEGVSAVFRAWEPARQDWTEFVLPLKDVHGDRGLGHLAHHGVAISKKRWPHFQELVVKWANEHKGLRPYGVRYEQFGWKADGVAFLIGKRLLSPGGGSRIAHGSPEVERRAKRLEPQGSLAPWRQAAETLFRRDGAEGHAFVVIAGFASILHPFTGAMGGAVVHMVSIQSGTGKSSAIETVGSIYGDLDGLRWTPRDTQVAKFALAGVLSNLPIVYDEARTLDPEELKNQVLQYTLGRDKLRGAADGGTRADDLPWSNFLLSAANTSMVDTVRHDGAEEAQAARIFEFVPAMPAGLTISEGEAQKRVLVENRGTAGEAFIKTCLDKLDWIKRAIPAAMASIEVQLGGGAEMRFKVRLLACVAVAGMLLEQARILDLDVTKVMQWAVAHVKGEEAASGTDLGTILGGLINDLVPHILVMPGAVKPGPRDLSYTPVFKPQREVQGRYEVEGRRLWLDERAVRKWMLKSNHPFTEVRKLAMSAGVVVRHREKVTLAKGAGMPGGQVRCWEIDGTHALVADLVGDLVAPDNVVPIGRRA